MACRDPENVDVDPWINVGLESVFSVRCDLAEEYYKIRKVKDETASYPRRNPGFYTFPHINGHSFHFLFSQK